MNIDHVATVRNARGGDHPDPLRAAIVAEQAGADGITAHLREDRRHISDTDIEILKNRISLPLNLEMAATEEMLSIALKHRPHAACIVPEKRAELTTEGGLNVAGQMDHLRPFVARLKDEGIRVSLFIDAEAGQIDAAHQLGADIVELHTGQYCESTGDVQMALLENLRVGVKRAHGLGLEVHAGHGLSFLDVEPIAAMVEVRELNIGHFLIGEAIFIGLEASIGEMRRLMSRAREDAINEANTDEVST